MEDGDSDFADLQQAAQAAAAPRFGRPAAAGRPRPAVAVAREADTGSDAAAEAAALAARAASTAAVRQRPTTLDPPPVNWEMTARGVDG